MYTHLYLYNFAQLAMFILANVVTLRVIPTVTKKSLSRLQDSTLLPSLACLLGELGRAMDFSLHRSMKEPNRTNSITHA